MGVEHFLVRVLGGVGGFFYLERGIGLGSGILAGVLGLIKAGGSWELGNLVRAWSLVRTDVFWLELKGSL